MIQIIHGSGIVDLRLHIGIVALLLFLVLAAVVDFVDVVIVEGEVSHFYSLNAQSISRIFGIKKAAKKYQEQL